MNNCNGITYQRSGATAVVPPMGAKGGVPDLLLDVTGTTDTSQSKKNKRGGKHGLHASKNVKEEITPEFPAQFWDSR